jgi:YgiT-type zinc finger domain-containing protein
MIKRSIDVDLRIGDPSLVVEAVPTTACDHCGEKHFTPAVTIKP